MILVCTESRRYMRPVVHWCFLYVWWQNNKQYIPNNILKSKRPFSRKRTLAETDQECVPSNFELKFDFLERLKNKYENTATKSKTMTNISFGKKK